MQTYRRERRIGKRPKHTGETKKVMRREKLLAKMLSQQRVRKLVANILRRALGRGRKKKVPARNSSVGKGRTRPCHGVSEAKTLPLTAQLSENPTSKGFHRIESAGQMILFEAEAPGPKSGQVSRGVATGAEVVRKDTFYVYCNVDSEEQPKHSAIHIPPPPKRSSPPSNKLPGMAASAQEMLEGRGLVVGGGKSKERVNEEKRSFFDFREYGAMIMANAYQR